MLPYSVLSLLLLLTIALMMVAMSATSTMPSWFTSQTGSPSSRLTLLNPRMMTGRPSF